jgi:hypothetical protein
MCSEDQPELLDERIDEVMTEFQFLLLATSDPHLLGPAQKATCNVIGQVQSLAPDEDLAPVICTLERVRRFVAMLRWGAPDDDLALPPDACRGPR